MPPSLAELIDRKGLCFHDLAKLAGVTTAGLRKLRQGRVRVARVSTVAGLAKALGVSPAQIRDAIEASRAAAES